MQDLLNNIYSSNDSAENKGREIKEVILETTLDWSRHDIISRHYEIAIQIIEIIK